MFNREVMFSKAAVELLSSAMSSSYQWSNYYNGKRTIWQQLWEEMMLCAYKCWKSATRNCLEHDSSCLWCIQGAECWIWGPLECGHEISVYHQNWLKNQQYIFILIVKLLCFVKKIKIKIYCQVVGSVYKCKGPSCFLFGIVENLEKCGAYHAKNLNEILKHTIDSY